MVAGIAHQPLRVVPPELGNMMPVKVEVQSRPGDPSASQPVTLASHARVNGSQVTPDVKPLTVEGILDRAECKVERARQQRRYVEDCDIGLGAVAEAAGLKPGALGAETWSRAVLEVVPVLGSNRSQVQEILSKAVANMFRAGALEQFISASHCELGPSFLQMRLRVDEEQRHLLSELRKLRLQSREDVRDFVTPPLADVTEAVNNNMAVLMARAERNPGRAAMDGPSPGGVSGLALPAPERPCAQPRDGQTLSKIMRQVSQEDPDCLFVARRIHKLGFKAPRTLAKHFSSHGIVVRVLAARSTIRQQGDMSHTRQRPSSFGFIQMATAEAVSSVLALGVEQEVQGTIIRVHRFDRQHEGLFSENADAEGATQCATSPDGVPRKHSEFSETTTCTTTSPQDTSQSPTEQHGVTRDFAFIDKFLPLV